MVPQVIRYPLDPTGTNPNNFIQGEPHTLVNRKVRAIAPTYGAFFTESLKIYDSSTNLPLTSEQFEAVEMYELPTYRYGKEICSIILITDSSVSNNVTLDYQCLGGEFGYSVEAIAQQIENLDLDSRPVAWPDIIAKPRDYPPSMHLHDIGDVYGFEYLVHAIDRLRAAVELGDAASHDVIYGYIDKIEGLLQAQLDSQGNALLAHENDFGNPHRVTAEQINVYVKGAVDAFINQLTNNLNAHAADRNNPHQVTAGQLKVYLKTETDALLSNLFTTLNSVLTDHKVDYNNPHRTTAAQVGAYTTAQIDTKLSDINAKLTNHTSDIQNPHQTTAVQVGLGNVPNLKMATATEFADAVEARFTNPAQVQSLMETHKNSGDHDARYILKGVPGVESSLMVNNGIGYMWINGAWRQIWPAQWA